MNELDINELYDYYKSALNNMGTFLLTEKSEDVDYYVFEEFDGDCISFINFNTLSVLLNNGLICETTFNLSIELSNRFRNMEKTQLWNSESVKNDPQWLEILIIADKIKSLLDIS